MSSIGRRQGVAVGGRRTAPAAAGWREPVDDVVGDPVALLLADQDVAGQLGVLGVLGQEVAEQEAVALDVAPRLLEQLQQPVSWSGCAAGPSRPTLAAGGRRAAFTGCSQLVHAPVTGRGLARGWLPAHGGRHFRRRGHPRRRARDPRRRTAWSLAGGRALTLSVRELALLVALASRPRRRSCAREELYRARLGRAAARRRPLDRRLRPQAAREARATRCRTGASSTRTSASATGSQPEPSHAFHNLGHGR